MYLLMLMQFMLHACMYVAIAIIASYVLPAQKNIVLPFYIVILAIWKPCTFFNSYIAIVLPLYRVAGLPEHPVLAPDVCAPFWLIVIMFLVLTVLFIFYGFQDHCSCGGGPKFYGYGSLTL